jgi:hypothetical protein
VAQESGLGAREARRLSLTTPIRSFGRAHRIAVLENSGLPIRGHCAVQLGHAFSESPEPRATSLGQCLPVQHQGPRHNRTENAGHGERGQDEVLGQDVERGAADDGDCFGDDKHGAHAEDGAAE